MNLPRKAIILGAAGRDFHNFNVFFRDNPDFTVVAFTAAQIPYIEHRTYPAILCGSRYPGGIPVLPEADLAALIAGHAVDDVFFCYSDVTHNHVMHLASISLAQGASFHLLGPKDTMLTSRRPVVAVLGARTGVGKSTITRYLFTALKGAGWKPVVVRHPMPYGRLDRAVERYETTADLVNAPITVEEMEEYQQHVEQGGVVYAGVDYGQILGRAEAEGDVILWDGGNNDMAFFVPSVTVTVADPLRPGEENRYHPGEANIRAADVVVINKVNAAPRGRVDECIKSVVALNPEAAVVLMESVESIDRPELVAGKDVLVVEDGPSVTHGGLQDAVGARAARLAGARLVDPRDYAVGSIRAALSAFPHMGAILPALGYSAAQLDELRESINNTPADAVLLGTPADLRLVLDIRQPVARARFDARDVSKPSLGEIVLQHLR